MLIDFGDKTSKEILIEKLFFYWRGLLNNNITHPNLFSLISSLSFSPRTLLPCLFFLSSIILWLIFY